MMSFGHMQGLQNWFVITKDEDFVKLWFDQEQGGVLWVRFGNCSNAMLVSRFQICWPQVLMRLRVGDRFLEVR